MRECAHCGTQTGLLSVQRNETRNRIGLVFSRFAFVRFGRASVLVGPTAPLGLGLQREMLGRRSNYAGCATQYSRNHPSAVLRKHARAHSCSYITPHLCVCARMRIRMRIRTRSCTQASTRSLHAPYYTALITARHHRTRRSRSSSTRFRPALGAVNCIEEERPQ